MWVVQEKSKVTREIEINTYDFVDKLTHDITYNVFILMFK